MCHVVLSFCIFDRDGKVRKSVERIFSIWEERSVYPEEVIAQFKAGLNKKEKEREKQKEKEKEKEKEKVAQPANGQFVLFTFHITTLSSYVNQSCNFHILKFVILLLSSANQHQSCPQVQDCCRVHSKSCLSVLSLHVVFKFVCNSCHLSSFALCIFFSLTPSLSSCRDISEQLQKRS